MKPVDSVFDFIYREQKQFQGAPQLVPCLDVCHFVHIAGVAVRHRQLAPRLDKIIWTVHNSVHIWIYQLHSLSKTLRKASLCQIRFSVVQLEYDGGDGAGRWVGNEIDAVRFPLSPQAEESWLSEPQPTVEPNVNPAYTRNRGDLIGSQSTLCGNTQTARYPYDGKPKPQTPTRAPHYCLPFVCLPNLFAMMLRMAQHFPTCVWRLAEGHKSQSVLLTPFQTRCVIHQVWIRFDHVSLSMWAFRRLKRFPRAWAWGILELKLINPQPWHEISVQFCHCHCYSGLEKRSSSSLILPSSGSTCPLCFLQFQVILRREVHRQVMSE